MYALLSHKNEILPFSTKIDLEGVYAKWNKSHRKRKILHDLTYMVNIKNKKQKQNRKQAHRYKEVIGDFQTSIGKG